MFKIIFGLGNPDSRHQTTRHNLGFCVLDVLRELEPDRWTPFKAGHQKAGAKEAPYQAAQRKAAGEDEDQWVLVKPLTYMNRSGDCVGTFLKPFESDRTEILVICDDVNLSLGVMRFRSRGSSGGQNGLQSIIDQLGTEAFARLRLGVGRDPSKALADYVLDEFSREEKKEAQKLTKEAALAAQYWLKHGIESAMNRFNQKNVKGS